MVFAVHPGMSDGLFTDSNYQMARKMMDYNVLRHQALAGNLANVETGGYKRMDVSPNFQSELNKALQSGNASAIESLQPKLTVDNSTLPTRADGNNVEMDSELMEMNRNSVEYEYLVQYMNYEYRMVRSSIGSQ